MVIGGEGVVRVALCHCDWQVGCRVGSAVPLGLAGRACVGSVVPLGVRSVAELA